MKLEFRGRQPSYRRPAHPLTLTLSPKSLPMTRYLNPESLCGNDSGERGQEVEDLTLSPKSLPMTRYLNPESLCGNDSGERGQERSWLNETVSFARLARFPSRGVDLPVVRAVRHSCGGFRPLRASSRRGRYVGSSSVSDRHPAARQGLLQSPPPSQTRRARICGPVPKLLIAKVCLRFGANGQDNWVSMRSS